MYFEAKCQSLILAAVVTEPECLFPWASSVINRETLCVYGVMAVTLAFTEPSYFPQDCILEFKHPRCNSD